MQRKCDCGGQKVKAKCYDWCSSLRPLEPIELDNVEPTVLHPQMTPSDWAAAMVRAQQEILGSCWYTVTIEEPDALSGKKT